MSQYIPDALRKLVAERARNRCEYCRISAIDTFFTFHIDHIISLKHGGETRADNLAYSCQICNLNKLNHSESVIERRVMIRFGMFG